MKFLFLISTVFSCSTAFSVTVPEYYKTVSKQNNAASEMVYAIALSEVGIENQFGHYVAWPWSVTVSGRFYQYKSRAELFSYLSKKLTSDMKHNITFGISGYRLSDFVSKQQLWDATSVENNVAFISKFVAYKNCKTMTSCVQQYRQSKTNKSRLTRRTYIAQKYKGTLTPGYQPNDYIRSVINEASSATGVDAALIAAVMARESAFKQYARSSAGAMGYMQLMPNTARYLGLSKKDFYNTKKNIFAGARYLQEQLSSFNGNIAYAVAAYNAGPGAVRKYNGVPPYKETKKYVPIVLSYYQYFSNLWSGQS